MRVVSYNTLLGGYDGDDDSRFHRLVTAINAARPDVLLLQELQNYHLSGGRRAYRLEREIGMRGFVAPSSRYGLPTAVYIGPNIKPISFDYNADRFHHAPAMLTAEVPGFDKDLTFVSVHLCPMGTPIRIQEAAALIGFGAPDASVLLGGDFNTLSMLDPVRENFWGIPPHHRSRHLDPDGSLSTRPMNDFQVYGFTDIAAHLGKNLDYTVPSDGHAEGNFCRVRLDYFLATADLAPRVKHYEVFKTPDSDVASDHFPILITIE